MKRPSRPHNPVSLSQSVHQLDAYVLAACVAVGM
jgi:hypothetical protein